MASINFYVTVESSDIDGRTAIRRIVVALKKVPEDSHVIVKTASPYVYDTIKQGRPWKWEQNNWLTEVRGSVINQKGTWIKFVEVYKTFTSFSIEML